METELKQKDEFALFKDYLNMLRINNEATIIELVNRLPHKKREFLNDILQTHRIIVDQKEGRTATRKIIKTKGRKIAAHITPPDQLE